MKILGSQYNDAHDDTKRDQLWDLIIEYGVASEETLQAVTGINGFTYESVCDVLYYFTGYRNLEQFEDAISEDN